MRFDLNAKKTIRRSLVQTPMNCHVELEKYPVWNVKPVKFIMQHLTQAAIKLPSTGDNMRYSV